MLGFVTRSTRPLVVFGGTALLVGVVLSTFFWLFASRLSMVPWHLVILGGLTGGLLAVMTDRRIRTTPPSPPVPPRRSIIPVWQVLFTWISVTLLDLIFPEIITPLVQIGLVLGVSGLSFGLSYARHHLTTAEVDLGSSEFRRFTLRAIQGLMWAVIAWQMSLLLLSLVHLKAPCSWLDLPRRRQGCLVTFDQASYPWESQISVDGSLVVTADANGGIYIWSSSQRVLVRRLEVPNQRVASLALSHDQQVIAAGFRDGTIRLWRIADGSLQHTFTEHTGRVNELFFSPDGQIMASASNDRTVRVWHLGTRRLMQMLAHPDQVSHVALMPDGVRLVAEYNATILVWDIQQGQVTRKLVLPAGIVSMAVSPDGQLIAAGLDDRTVQLWRSPNVSAEKLVELRDRADVLAFSPDGVELLMSASTEDVRIVQVADGTLVRTVALDDHIQSARFTPQQLLLVTNSLGAAFLWQR